ncbi:hypothetical protein IAU60_003820 [Kwoniella sp. DSM 27419]
MIRVLLFLTFATLCAVLVAAQPVNSSQWMPAERSTKLERMSNAERMARGLPVRQATDSKRKRTPTVVARAPGVSRRALPDAPSDKLQARAPAPSPGRKRAVTVAKPVAESLSNAERMTRGLPLRQPKRLYSASLQARVPAPSARRRSEVSEQ